MVTLVLALLAADPHGTLVLPEKLSALDQKTMKIARDIAKEDRVYHQLHPVFDKLRVKPDAGVPLKADAGIDPSLVEWDDQQSVVKSLHAELDEKAAAVREMRASKTGVTVDAARDMEGKLDALDKKVDELHTRIDRLVKSLKLPAK